MTEPGETTKSGEGIPFDDPRDQYEYPYLVRFLFVLPEPVDVENHYTFTYLMDGESGGETFADDLLKHRAASFTVHHVDRKVGYTEAEWAHRALMSVSRDLNSEAMRSEDDQGSFLPLSIRNPTTVIEASVVVRDYSESHTCEQHPGPDPLQMCIDTFLDWHRAFRVYRGRFAPELTYQRINRSVLWFMQPFPPHGVKPVPEGVITLDNRAINLPAFETMSEDDQHALGHLFRDVIIGHPFVSYAERRLQAKREAYENGRFGEAISQASTAAEVLISGCLRTMLWEESVRGDADVDLAVVTLKREIEARLTAELHTRIGGSWSIKAPHVHAWKHDIWDVRGRVVHGGYRASEAEAERAFEALRQLENYLVERIAKSYKNYPRTGWLLAGDEGYRRVGTKAHKRALAWIEKQEDYPVGWYHDFNKWDEQVRSALDSDSSPISKPPEGWRRDAFLIARSLKSLVARSRGHLGDKLTRIRHR